MEKKYDPERDGDFNRDDSNTEKRPRRSAATEESVSSPFVKDKRPRIRRVTEQLNERTPRPRVERDGTEQSKPSPYRRDDRPYEERPATRDAGATERRRSYNPNFDEENRLRRPVPQGDRRYESSEEDNRFNSYNYDRERPQRDSRDYPQRDNRRPYNEDRQPQGDRQGYNRDNRGYGSRDNNRGYGHRDNNNDNRGYGNRDNNRGYGSRDNNRGYDNRNGGGRSYPQRDDRNSRPGYGDRRQQRPDNRQGGKKPADPFRTPKGGYDSEFKPKVYPAYAAANIVEPIRLNKFISMSGLCSRREADEFIKEGNVTVNGQVVTEMGVKINPTDEVRYNGEMLQGEKRVYILMNKPKGFVTTVEDPNADKTVMDIVKNACKERVYPVGRLDKNSLGVLLITNDGELTKKLTHPSHEKRKVYQVTLDRAATPEDLEKLYEGITLDDGVAKADEVEFLDEKRREVGIAIHTGRNRIVRRMFEELGYHVQKLDRVYFAGLTKKGLRRGAWRYLTPKEVAMVKSGAYQ